MEYFLGNSRKRKIVIDPLRGTAGGVSGGGLPPDPDGSLTPFDFTLGTKLIQTGFESNLILTDGVPSAQRADFSGIDNSVPVPNNWDVHLEQSGHVHDSRIYFENGTSADRLAEIVNSPKAGDGQGKVLHFQLSNAAIFRDGVPFKGRVQHSVSGVTGMKQIYFKTKMYLPPHMEDLKLYSGTLSWFTIAEWWNDQGSDPDPFRITVAIHKPNAAIGSALRFDIHGQERVGTKWAPGLQWHQTNTNFSIPTDTWMTMEYYVQEGGEPGTGAPEGRFVMVVTPEGGSSEIIFDIKKRTHHQDIGTGGAHGTFNGYEDFQVHKLYCGLKEITHMQSLGNTLDVYWDDFELWFQS